jgi:hypothetical protein
MAATDATKPALTPERFGLKLWSLATYRTASFAVAVALILHLRGELSSRLHALDTATGIALFLLLWTTTWFASRRGVRDHHQVASARSAEPALMYTTVAGGWNGLYVYAGLVLFFATPVLLAAPAAGIVIVAASAMGAVIAFTVGSVVGLAFGALEALLFGISSWIASRCEEST